jgi:hypothetical protein
MTPNEALQVIAALTERVSATRTDHALGLDALETLRLAIPPAQANEPVKIAPLARVPLTETKSRQVQVP